MQAFIPFLAVVIILSVLPPTLSAQSIPKQVDTLWIVDGVPLLDEHPGSSWLAKIPEENRTFVHKDSLNFGCRSPLTHLLLVTTPQKAPEEAQPPLAPIWTWKRVQNRLFLVSGTDAPFTRLEIWNQNGSLISSTVEYHPAFGLPIHDVPKGTGLIIRVFSKGLPPHTFAIWLTP